LQVLHTDSKYNKDTILKYLICEHYLLNNADSFRIFFANTTYLLFTRYFPYRTPTLFLRSRAMHKLLTYFSFLKPCEMTTFYRENI
jgi:hypothetical protein